MEGELVEVGFDSQERLVRRREEMEGMEFIVALPEMVEFIVRNYSPQFALCPGCQ